MRLTGVCIGLLAGLMAAELTMWLLGIEPQKLISKRRLFEESNQSVVFHCYPSNPNDEFQPLPDTSRGRWHLTSTAFEPVELPLARIGETPWCVRYEFSSRRIRDREYSPHPAENVLRIACVGDSFVFGEGVPLEKTLCRQMHALLGDDYEVVNAGVVGADSVQELHLLRKMAAEAHCSRALFVFIPNDIPLSAALQDRQKYINDLINIRDEELEQYENRAWYTGHLRVLHFAGAQLAMRRIHAETIQWYLDSYNPQFNAENLKLLREVIGALAEIPDCRVAFVLYPLMDGFEDGYPLASIHRQVAGMARNAGLPVLDLAPVFEGIETSSLWVHHSDHHPNGKAHALAAAAIVEWLENGVPGFLTKEPLDQQE